MVLALFRTLEFKKVFIYTYIYKYWRFFCFYPRLFLIAKKVVLLLYYLYCLCKFLKDRFFLRLLFFSESGCKGKNFKAYLPNVFGSFFLFFFFLVVSLIEREAKRNILALTPFLSECQTIAALVLESGCKSTRFTNTHQIYLSLFLQQKWNFFVTRWLIKVL